MIIICRKFGINFTYSYMFNVIQFLFKLVVGLSFSWVHVAIWMLVPVMYPKHAYII